MKIFIASDHAGFALKEKLRDLLLSEGHEVEDCGPETFDAADDYTDYVAAAARKLARSPEARALVIGGSGQGEAMMGNRFKGVRAAVFYGGAADVLRASRADNDSNMLALGARFVDFEKAKEVLNLWLTAPFSGEERHARRVGELDSLS